MRRYLLICLLICISSSAVFAQQVAVSGTVLDDYGHGLKGASVATKNNSASAVSDASGQFQILAAKGDVLYFSYPDFSTREIKVTDSMPLLIVKLVKNNAAVRDRVDVLYETRDKSKVLGSVSTIYAGQITTTPSPNYAYAFAGRLPGLYTQQTRGWTATNSSALVQQDLNGLYYPTAATIGAKGPNDNTEISLSLRGQAPVTFVDGVQRDIYTIDPENIESVSVLKDVLSTILLGQRSSRGVILVTTKKPIAGTPHVSLTAQTGIQTPLSLPDPLSAYQYAYLYNEAQSNQGNQQSYTYPDFEAYRNHTDPYGHPDVNWFNTILKDNASISRYSLNVSGGGTSARYAVAIGYFNQQGLFKGSNADYQTNASIKRYTINSNVDVDITKEFNARLQIFAKVQDGNQPGGTTDGIISSMYSTPNNAYPVSNPNGSFGGTQAFQTNLYGQLTSSGYLQDYTRDILANLELNYKFDRFIKGLYAKAQTNLSVYSANSVNRTAAVPSFKLSVGAGGDSTYSRYGTIQDQNNAFNLTYSAQFWYLQTTLGYARQWGKSSLDAKLFYDQYQRIFNYDLPETTHDIAATASYDWGKKYFAEAAVNYSGNDRYPPGKQFGWFYAGGLGWNIAEENFIKNNSSLTWINNLKLRATYGKTGNDNVGYFSWRESFQIDQVIPTYPISSTRVSQQVARQTILANPNITWEKANKFNVGADVALFKNHVQFTADYYINRYYDLLQNRGKQPALIGQAYPLENLGINRYTGTELSATYQDNIGDFHFYISGNANFQQSKVLFSDEIVQKYDWNRRTGQPVGMQFGYVTDGFIQTQAEAESSPHVAGYTLQPGDLKLKDLNGDGTINQYDQQPIGEQKPLFFYGATAGISFKGFDASILLQGVANRTYQFDYLAFGFGSSQAYTFITGRWTPETANTATYPRLTPGFNNNNDATSTFWQRNGDYFRIKNAEIGYTLPFRFTNHIKISSVRFFANGLNLFTHAAFDRVDPEAYGQVYPIQKVVNFGVNVKF